LQFDKTGVRMVLTRFIHTFRGAQVWMCEGHWVAKREPNKVSSRK